MKLERTPHRLKQLVARVIVRVLDRVIPKNRRLWVFANGRDTGWGSNLRAVYDAAQGESDIETVIVNMGATDTTRIRAIYGTEARIVRAESLEGLWALLRSGVAFITHGASDFYWPVLTHRRVVINLWHGVAIKAILYLERGRSPREARRAMRVQRRFNAVICSSKADRLAMTAMFRALPHQVEVTGLPRNDWLLHQELPADLAAVEESLAKHVGGRKLVLYAPSYRTDGSGLYRFSQGEADSLAAMLREHDAVLGLRAHINRPELSDLVQRPECLDLSPSAYGEVQVLLRNTQVLVTDYSGIWVDFLLTDRPVIGFVHDWEEYVARHAFLYDFEHVFPGRLVRTPGDLESALASALTSPGSDASRRKSARRLFHDFEDGASTARVLALARKRAGL